VLKPDIRKIPDHSQPGVYYYASGNLTSALDLFKFSFVYPDPLATSEGASLANLIIRNHISPFVTFDLSDPYEILAYAAEPRSLPLGAIARSIAGFSGGQNLQVVFPPDTWSNGYRDHPWHSGEFNFDNMMQQGYWRALLNAFKLNATQSVNP